MTLQPEEPARRPSTPAGWYASPDPSLLRFWDGTKWTDYTAPMTPGSAHATGLASSPEQRRIALAQAVGQVLSSGAARVESSTDYQVVVVVGQQPNHVLHALLSIFTCGLWLPIWLLIAITTKENRSVGTVDEYGQVHWT